MVTKDQLIAVEGSLTNVKQALEREGYRTVELAKAKLNQAQAIVISGMDVNVMQMQDIATNVPVIDASGMSADEVLRNINRRLLS